MSSLRKQTAISSFSKEWMNNVPQAIDTYCNEEMSPIQYDYGILSLAILLLGHQYTDEAHNLITPYSWPEEIHTSYGPVKYPTADEGVVSMATYIHSLVHRREGWNVGELGMVGWSNADYWGSAWARPFQSSEILRELWRGVMIEIQPSILQLAKYPSPEQWCRVNLPELFLSVDEFVDAWDPRALHRLCALVTKDGNSDSELMQFAQEACKVEMHALLMLCLEKAGYTLPSNETDNSSNPATIVEKKGVDENIALSAANRVSSAHAAAFSTDGIVVLRNLIKTDQFKESDCDNVATSVAAGISTRLLNVCACRSISHGENMLVDCVGILLLVNEDQAERYSDIASYFGKGPLFVGDALAVSGSLLENTNSQAMEAFQVYSSCSSDDIAATFVNTLHGGRGETPTTVVQWSKGTVHYSSSNYEC